MDVVPANVKEMSDDEAFKLSATENIQSESLKTPQKKRLVQQSLDRYGSLVHAADEMNKNKKRSATGSHSLHCQIKC
jgi:hypothetical protein